MIPEPDRVRLRHMLDAATKAIRFAEGRGRGDLENDEEPLADALVRLVSVIGEAASRVSLWATVQDNLPSLIQALELVLAQDEEA